MEVDHITIQSIFAQVLQGSPIAFLLLANVAQWRMNQKQQEVIDRKDAQLLTVIKESHDAMAVLSTAITGVRELFAELRDELRRKDD